MMNIRKVASHIERARTLAELDEGYEEYTEKMMEAEGTSHLVIPLLRALGWSDEQIAVEWNHPEWPKKGSRKWCRIDVCVFKKTPRSSEHLYYLIEVKRLWHDPEGSLKLAFEEAKAESMEFKPPCDVVATNGIVYEMHHYDPRKNNFSPYAPVDLSKLNANRLRRNGSSPQGSGLTEHEKSALRLFARMSPPS